MFFTAPRLGGAPGRGSTYERAVATVTRYRPAPTVRGRPPMQETGPGAAPPPRQRAKLSPPGQSAGITCWRSAAPIGAAPCTRPCQGAHPGTGGAGDCPTSRLRPAWTGGPITKGPPMPPSPHQPAYYITNNCQNHLLKEAGPCPSYRRVEDAGRVSGANRPPRGPARRNSTSYCCSGEGVDGQPTRYCGGALCDDRAVTLNRRAIVRHGSRCRNMPR